MQITSRFSENRPQYQIVDWKNAGLKMPSYVRYANIHHIDSAHVLGTIGKLMDEEYLKIISLLKDFLRQEKKQDPY
ncbi:hypothetical protein BSNK01_04720 [Bacillaceae bacterium]